MMDASVVDLPLPVVPVTSTSPLGRRDVLDGVRQMQVGELGHLEGNQAGNYGQLSAFAEDVDVKPSGFRDGVREVLAQLRFNFLVRFLGGETLYQTDDVLRPYQQADPVR